MQLPHCWQYKKTLYDLKDQIILCDQVKAFKCMLALQEQQLKNENFTNFENTKKNIIKWK